MPCGNCIIAISVVDVQLIYLVVGREILNPDTSAGTRHVVLFIGLVKIGSFAGYVVVWEWLKTSSRKKTLLSN